MYNEEKIALGSMKKLYDFLSGSFDDFEIIVSNDGSTDSTQSIMNQFSADHPRLRVVGYDDNRGKGSAVREGILVSDGDIVVYTDCDLAYGTAQIKGIIDKLTQTGADIVLGSRTISKDGYEGYTFLRKLASKIYIKVISAAAGFRHSDSQSGLKCFKGDAARKIFSLCTVNGFAFDLEALMIAEKL
ncbi:MAG: glycosyltransferase, partial [Clostridia bacterium]|nr:glycosyltransferase [Clostridia bacterium]